MGIILVIGLMPSMNLQKAYADDDATANEDAPAVVEGGEAGDAALAPADDVSSIDEDVAALSDFDADVISAFALDSGVRPLAAGAFAIYSADDQSLSFYYGDVPTAGGTYNGKAATTVYTNFTFSSADYVAWNGRRSYTASVFVDDSFSAFKPSSTAYWFYDFTSCTSFAGMENLNMSDATNMAYMFYSCTSVEFLDLSGWNTSKVSGYSRFLGDAGGLDYITIGDDFNLFTHGGDGSAVISDFAT